MGVIFTMKVGILSSSVGVDVGVGVDVAFLPPESPLSSFLVKVGVAVLLTAVEVGGLVASALTTVEVGGLVASAFTAVEVGGLVASAFTAVGVLGLVASTVGGPSLWANAVECSVDERARAITNAMANT